MRSLAKPSASTGTKWDTLGTIVLGIILLMPVIGLLYPPDTWLNYKGDDVAARQAASSLPITSAIARLTTAIALFWLVKNWRGYLVEAKYSFLIWLQLVAFSSSTLWSEDPWVSFSQVYSLFITYILMLYVVHKYSVNEFVALLVRLMGISAVVCIALVVFLPGLGHNLDDIGYFAVWRGGYVQKNPLGEACSFGILAAAYSLYSGANSRLVASLVLAGNVICIFGSDSVTSILTTVIGLMIYAVAYMSKTFLGRVILVLGVLVVGLLAITVVTNVDNLAGLVGRNPGLTGRTGLWFLLDQLIAKRPMHGYGLGFWGFGNQEVNNVWLQLKWAAPEAHNDILDVLLQTGYVGFTFYVINNFTALFLGLRRFGHLEDGSIFCLAIIVVFFYRSYAETGTLIISGKIILMLYIAEAYLYKLSFSRQAGIQLTKKRNDLSATLNVVAR